MRRSSIHADGFVIVDDRQVADTLQCVHCMAHFEVVPGSGNKRGFCTKCAGPTCSPKCSGKCVPAEQWLTNVEKGLPEDFVPVIVSVPRSIHG